MSQRIVVVGAGGFGRETLDVIEAINRSTEQPKFAVLGVIDDAPDARMFGRLATRNVAYLGRVDEWLASGEDAEYLIGVGEPRVRRVLDSQFVAAGYDAATVIHPAAVVGSVGSIGSGTVICAGAQVSTNVILGRQVHINPNATIGHDSVLGDYTSINPGAVISGDVAVEQGSLIGAGAIVLQGLKLGQACTVGAAACVVRDVLAHSTVKGVPAK